jgi:uncharacterized protein with HEPN domain
MPLDRDDASLLWDMMEAATKIEQFVAGKTPDAYAADELLQAGVERKLEIIGEAARKVSDSFKQAHPEIPWRGITSQRHFLAHQYGEVRHEKLWHVATVRIPELIALLAPLIGPPPKGEG